MMNKLNPTERKKILLAGVITLILVTLFLIFSPFGVIKYNRLKRTIAEINETNQRLESENQALLSELEQLKNDPSYLEKIAREKFGLIKDNEIIYETKKPKK